MRRRTGLQEDYVLRMIRQAGETLARLRARLMGTDASPETLRRDAAAAIELLLGSEAPLLAHLDAATAVWLAGHAQRVAVWAALLDVEADAAMNDGDAATASTRHARATALREASATLWKDE